MAGDTEQGAQPPSEQSPLLVVQASSNDDLDSRRPEPEGKATVIIWTVLAGVFVVGLILVFTLPVHDWGDPFPSPGGVLKYAPVIDGHIGPSITLCVCNPQYLGSFSVCAIRLARARSRALCEQRVCV